MTTEPDSDELDGCVENFTLAPQAADEDLDNIALFATVDITDQQAVEARAVEWRALFPEEVTDV